ncbi:PDR2 [Symbiodinium sp. CCMP2592]|nr:PDR2 [Symbiodinium sp. CCMP2592]
MLQLVVPLPREGHANDTRVALVPLIQEDGQKSISYLKKKFVYNSTTGKFERLHFEITSPLEFYLGSTGLTAKEVDERKRKYGENIYDIPLPDFWELFQEHAVAPFFVFQLFCVLLWLMDEYWYYSLLTLFLLVVLEAQMVHRRRHDLSELRSMRIPPMPTLAFRDGQWQEIQSNQLLPGDIIGIQRNPEASFPCDALLLQGNVLVNEAMLTGESVPQMKVHAAASGCSSGQLLDMLGRHKQHIVSAGTNIMMHQNSEKGKNQWKRVPATRTSPLAVGFVLRTGFDTTQGKLCRTILFSADRVTVSSKEAYCFIAILLFFAVLACIYVLYDGLVLVPARGETPRSTFKLLLAVSHIITSVVPPEFPIMLSLAVNLSLVALVSKRIFCTEPFRVPLAGQIQTCCFDKTGTLTSDSMEVGGVHGLEYPAPPLVEAVDEKEVRDVVSPPLQQKLPFLSTAVMAACNGLTVVEGEVVGDPLEKASLQAIRWLMKAPDLITSKTGKGQELLHVLRRWPFVSELRRMAVVVRHRGPGLGYQETTGGGKDLDRVLALVKGSCDALKPRLVQVPPNLDDMQDQLTKFGFRVLCLAAKELPGDKSMDAELLERDDVETGLQFCGLLVLRNSVKPNTSNTIRQLRQSYHRVIMITGDHPLTACQVAKNVSMAENRFLVLDDVGGSAEGLEWKYWDHQVHDKIAFTAGEELRKLARSHTLCVTGGALAKMTKEEVAAVVEVTTVFARVSPQQKEQVVVALNTKSHTVMVGDGTNDVGALKHAHVGISLMTTSIIPRMPTRSQAQKSVNEMLADNGQVPLVRLGDASIASPFTYKGDSIKCSIQVLRSGRATLCSVLMMYKIMGLNSILSAFAMSALTLDGVKLGDGQTAMESLFTSMCFFLVSRSAPAKQLARQQPISSVFAWPVMATLGIQLIIHMAILLPT